MTKISKKIISALLAVMMVVCSLPLSGLVAFAKTTTEWTVAASTDFTKSSFAFAQKDDDLGNRLTSNNYVSTTSEGGSQMMWDAYEWTNDYITTDANGANLNDGLLYMSGNDSGKTTPITGAEAFKIDIEFSFTGEYTISSRNDGQGPTFLKLTRDGNGTSFVKNYPWDNNFFAQEGYGRQHSAVKGGKKDTDGSNVESEGGKSRISTDNLTIGETYHYILTLEDNYLYPRVTDSNGKVVIKYGAITGNFDTSMIQGIYLGGCYGYYYQNLAFKSVVLYTGTTTKSGNKTFVSADKDKYVLTYFTGNDEAGETLHMAVSDDGMNWEALNGNNPIWSSANLSGTEQSYPDNSGVAASGHVRDPYAFQAQDGTYYILATDLNTENGTNWGNNSKLMVWHLNSLSELANTNPWYIDTSSIMIDAGITDYVSRAWAPEAIWDEEVGHYMLFWGCGNIDGHTVMYYAYTDDFKTLLSTPEQLIVTGVDNIDGNITFDGEKYYMWFKDESQSKIAVATSNHASGPYGNVTSFTDNKFDSHFEGPEVYQLNNGDYVLIADYYKSNVSYFASYLTNSTPDSFHDSDRITVRLNHLSPRHGSVINITTEEYNKLVAAYGKSTFDITGVESGKNVNDYLVARYFTTDDVNYDATGHGYTLISTDVTMTSDFNGRAAAKFTGTSSDSTSANSSSTKGDSYNKNGSYAQISTSEMLKDLDLKNGVTFSWYGYAENCNSGRWFDWSTSTTPGQISWDDKLGLGQSQSNNRYVYSASNMEFGANNLGATAIADGYISKTNYKGAWHEYTMSVTHGYICFWVDGALLYTSYNTGSVSKQGTPIALDSMNSDFFTNIVNGNLYFGISSYAADGMLNGYISDFKIYNRALSTQDITDSKNLLDNYYPKNDLDTSACVYYDPMEDKTTEDGTVYTSYAQSVQDPVKENGVSLHGTVLNMNGGVNSHYTYYGSNADSSKGFTLSMWYNPGADVSDETIFQIGTKISETSDEADGVPSRYVELSEDGHFYFNYKTGDNNSYFTLENVFGDSLPTNAWSHITIQVQPNANSSIVYVYIDGRLVSTTNLFSTDNDSVTYPGVTLQQLLSEDFKVYYGSTAGDFCNSASQDCYLDDFRIYNGLFDATEVFNNDSYSIADTLINKAVNAYKEKMALLDNKDYVYTNMADAYLAYDKAMRYLDSVKYGEKISDAGEILELYQSLVSATDAMVIYQKPATKQGMTSSEANVSNAISEQYTHNLISSIIGLNSTSIQNYNPETGKIGTEDDDLALSLTSTNFVWLYTGIDGDTPTAPINAAVRKTAKTRYIESIYFKNDTSNPSTQNGVTISSPFKFSSTSEGDVQNWVFENTSGLTDVPNYCVTDMNKAFKVEKNKTWYQGSSYLSFTGTLTDADDYYITINPLFNFSETWTSLGSGNNANLTIQDTGTIYVINFSKVRSVFLDSKLTNYLVNITDYSPQSTLKLLQAYDNLTNVDYNLSGTLENEVKEICSVAEENVNYLLGVDLSKIEAKADGSGLYEEANEQAPFVDAAEGTVDENGSITVGTVDENGSFVPTLDENGNQMKYTTSSWASYIHAYDALTKYFTDLCPYGTDNQYATSQSQVDAIKNNVEKARASLQIAADYTDVDSAVTKDSVHTNRVNRNYLNDEQIYTVDSYINFSNAYESADVWHNKDSAYRADTERYNVSYVKSIVSNGVTYSNGPYIAYDTDGNIVTSASQTIDYYKFIGDFYDNEGDSEPSQFETGDYVLIDGTYTKLNGYRFYTDISTVTDSSGNYVYSTRQNAIIDTAADLVDKDDKLESVDEDEAYEAFDSVLTVVDAIDTAKYTKAGLEYLQNAVNTANANVYEKLTGSTLAAYNKATQKSFIEGYKVKKTALSKTDAQSSSVLTAINTINDESNKALYINKFEATLDVQIEGDSQGTVSIPDAYYGEMFTLNGSSLVDGKDVSVSSWSVSIYDEKDDSNNPIVKSSQKISSYVGDTLTRIADTNIAVTVNYDYDTNNSESGYRYEVYDVYKHLTAVVYNNNLYDTSTVADGLQISAKTIPFYTFCEWIVSSPDENNVITVKPSYSLVQTYTITASDATVSGYLANNEDGTYKAKYDAQVTVSTSDSDFYAWAVKSAGNNKYSVASYKPTYSFYVACNEEYVQIKKSDSGYTVNGVAVSDENIACTLANDIYDDVTQTDYIVQKLDSKAPFVSVECVTMNNNQARVYVRQTTGGNVKITSYGVVYASGEKDETVMVKNGTGVYTRTVNNALDSGQYCFTLNSTNGFKNNNITFRAFVNYDFTYKFTHTTGTQADDNQADINALEYSNVSVATKQA